MSKSYSILFLFKHYYMIRNPQTISSPKKNIDDFIKEVVEKENIVFFNGLDTAEEKFMLLREKGYACKPNYSISDNENEIYQAIDTRTLRVPYCESYFHIEVRYFNMILQLMDGTKFYTDNHNYERKNHPCFYTTCGIVYRDRSTGYDGKPIMSINYKLQDIYSKPFQKKRMVSIHEVIALLKGEDLKTLKPVDVEDATFYSEVEQFEKEEKKVEFEFQ